MRRADATHASESEDENDENADEQEESEEESSFSEDEDVAEEDDDNTPGTPPTPPGTPPPEQIRQEVATETVDKLFRIAKLRMVTPPRWTKVFIGAAQQYEKRLDEKREQLYMAVAQDDVELLLNIKKQVSDVLWHWWAYDLLLVVRASFRIRPKTLEHLPDLAGDAYPGFRKVQDQRAALDEQLAEGSSISIAEMQLGMALLRPLQKHLEEYGEINVDNSGGLHGGMEELLNNRARGPWQDSDAIAAIGVNFGMSHVVFAGWRAIHFVAANIHATESAIPALELLFKANADATIVDKGGATALHLAALRGNLNIINCLLDNGSPLEAEDMEGCSAMNIAGRCRHYHLIKAFAQWLLPEDAWPKLFYTEAERLASHYSLPNGLALHIAVVRGSIEKVKELVNLEPPDTANVNYADPGGRRAVHLAAGFISDEHVGADMLQLLVGQKAEVNARDSNSETPLHLAARLGRATVVKTLLLLHAHPNLPDFGNRTPMMLAAAGPDEERMPPAYNGTLVNKPLPWTTIQNLLDWNGRGDPPIKNGPQPRRVRGKAASTLQRLMGGKAKGTLPAINAKGKKVVQPEPEEVDDEEKDSDEEEDESYFSSTDSVRARAVALCDLGFDDQYIIDRDGRVNRGDRMQLFQHLFQADRAWIPEFPGDIAPLKPNDVRCRFVWKHLTGPLLQMAQKSNVPPRATELLSYVLRVMLGNRGPAYGVFVSTGFDGGTLPLWTQIEEAIHTKTLDKRVEAVLSMGFVGGKPKLQSWVGSCWNLDEYPRNPVYAPWGAFEYLDKKDPDKPPLVILRKHDIYNKLPPRTSTTGQAFKDNFFSVFEPVQKGTMSSSTLPIVCRHDRLCLANRLYVNETYGVRQQVEIRARLVGEMLICPLLHEILDEIDKDGIAKENKDRRDILDYCGVSMSHPKDTYVYVNQPRRPFKDLWEDVEEKAVKVFCKEKDPVILDLGPKEDSGRIHNKMLATKLKGAAKAAVGLMSGMQGVTVASHSFLQKHKEDTQHSEAARHDLVTHVSAMPHQSIELMTKGAPPGDYGQFTLISDDDKRWLLRGESTRAFVELKRCSCIGTCEEFSDLICALAVGGLQDFHGRFWRATFGLFLWGRAKLLNPIFEVELQRRLPKSKTYELKGPFLRPRSDVLEVCDLALKAKEDLALMSSEAPWEKKEKVLLGWGMTEEKVRPPLDFNAGKPGGGVKLPDGIALYSGFTDLLHADILCNNAAAMVKAFQSITGAPTQNLSKRKSFQGSTRASTTAGSTHSHMTMFGKEGRTKFTVLRVVNHFREDQQKVIPLCAGIKLVAVVGWTPLGYGPPIEQLVEIELMLKVTPQARWLAKYMDIFPEMMPKTRNEDDEWKPQGKPKLR